MVPLFASSDSRLVTSSRRRSSRIVTSTQQIAMNVLLLGMDAAQAIDAPRIHHQGQPDALRIEDGDLGFFRWLNEVEDILADGKSLILD